ncbi:MAG: CoA transferase [Dehalococcoidia bacterium]|nr:CoA transferase [Dehalococcoidia bacterium]
MPLDDVRVIDLTQGAMGPFCTRVLADYGADVIKIEPPGAGDPARMLPPFLADEPGPERSGLFLFLNTSKRSVTLDVTRPRGRELLLQLVRGAQVVVESFKPGTLAQLGLDYATLRAANPQLVLTSITNFGQHGPYAQFEAESLTAYAMGGAMLQAGDVDHEPLKTAGRMAEYQAGLSAALATSLALLGAERRGAGEHLDVSLFETATHSIDQRLGRLLGYEHGGHVGTRTGLASMVGSGVYPAADGFFFFTAGVQYITQMIRMIGHEELFEQPEWATAEARAHPDRIAEFPQYLLPWSVTRTMTEIRDACQEYGVLGGPINTIPALLADPSFVERKFFQQIDHPVVGPQTYPGYHFTLHREQPMPPRRHAPLLGAHTEAVLCGELHLGAAELAELRREGVV